MYENQKIGVGIITYDRPENFANIFTQVRLNRDIDYIAVVKNKTVDYGQYDPSTIKGIDYINVVEDLGVGYCKNQCLKRMISNGCDHMFLIEDDISIKDQSVFGLFIKTAAHFKVGHLNFNALPGIKNQQTFNISYEGLGIAVSTKLCGCFSYFERDALLHVGLLDERYVNCLEHCEHAYRFSIMGFCPPFYAFPGICSAWDYLDYKGSDSSIERKNDLYLKRALIAKEAFKSSYGIYMKDIGFPSNDDVKKYFILRLKSTVQNKA